VTLGGDGCVAALAGSRLRMPAFKVRVVDPTGAGDAFSAGIILKVHRALSRGRRAEDFSAKDWRAILIYGSACGAVCATGVGTTTAVDPRKVRSLIDRQGHRFL
jgi:fructokinase